MPTGLIKLRQRRMPGGSPKPTDTHDVICTGFITRANPTEAIVGHDCGEQFNFVYFTPFTNRWCSDPLNYWEPLEKGGLQ